MKQQIVLRIKNKSEILYLRLDSILYIQADGNYCNIYLTDGGVISTLTYQRAEIARLMEEQLPAEIRKQFVLVGRSYMVNTNYVLRIQPSRHILTFGVNIFGTTRKISIKATSKALDMLALEMEKQTNTNNNP
jgi:DNA-binding LytR/AlgR family response regulator